MAKRETTKKPMFGNRRSHACNATRHAQKPNYIKTKNENGETIITTARELRTMKKSEAA